MGQPDWERPEERGVETMGERVRSLRRSAGLSQEELAAGRFSKEYVSQIERGKTRPTAETLEWLADRLATDREFLEHGLTLADSQRLEAALAAAERILEDARYAEALKAFADVRALAGASPATTFSLRLLLGEAWAHIRLGELPAAMALLEPAAALAVGAGFTDVDRAEIVFRVGVVRYSESSINEAIVLFGQALLLAESSDLLRRSPALGHPALARTVSSAQPRLGTPPRRTSSARWSWPKRAPTPGAQPMRSSRRRSSRSGRDAGCSHARTPSSRGRCSRSWGTVRPWPDF